MLRLETNLGGSADGSAMVRRLLEVWSRIRQGEWLRERHLIRRGFRWWVRSATRLARTHRLDPRVFLALAFLGAVLQGLFYLPWFKGEVPALAFLVALRFVGLIGPIYILLRGKDIAAAVNASLVVGWSLSTAWSVCYYVYL